MKRVLVAVIGSLPVAVVGGISSGLAINLPDALSTILFWLIWGGSIYYALREVGPKKIFGRTAMAYAVAAFSLPITAAIFALTGMSAVESDVEQAMGEAEGPLEGFLMLLTGAALAEFVVILSVGLAVFGIVTGIIAVILARVMLKPQ